MTNGINPKSTISFPVNPYGRQLSPGQKSVLVIFDLATGTRNIVFETDHLIEAPNWRPSGDELVFNAGGQLWCVGIDGQGLRLLDTAPLADLNNDHVLSPDGRSIYLSSDDGHLYRTGRDGGSPDRVSGVHPEPFRYYLHGVSPDEQELAYVGIEGNGANARRNLYLLSMANGVDRLLLDSAKPSDGPEYSPDGKWIYFNSELRSDAPGHAQLFRMNRNGENIEQLTYDERVNWFPHVSPDGKILVFLSYPAGTIGHPSDKEVIIRSLGADGTGPRDLASFNGGQGSLNVNSWAPDSRRFAYVEYPFSQ